MCLVDNTISSAEADNNTKGLHLVGCHSPSDGHFRSRHHPHRHVLQAATPQLVYEVPQVMPAALCHLSGVPPHPRGPTGPLKLTLQDKHLRSNQAATNAPARTGWRTLSYSIYRTLIYLCSFAMILFCFACACDGLPPKVEKREGTCYIS